MRTRGGTGQRPVKAGSPRCLPGQRRSARLAGMGMPIAFDTHTYVKRLVAAGMPEAQAEVQAEALTEVVLAKLATKDDLALMEQRIVQRFAEMDTRLKDLGLRLTLRTGVMLAAGIAIVAALVKLL